MISITVFSGPRPIPMLDRTISSLRESGFNQKIHISAEPGAIIGQHDNIEVFQNEKLLGNRLQWETTLRRRLDETEEPWLMFVEDDIECDLNTAEKITDFCAKIEQPIGFVSGYTPKAYAVTWPWLNKYNGWARLNRGWNTWGFQCIIMQRESVELLLTAEKMRSGTAIPDAVLGEFFEQKKLACYYAIPSLIEHIGLNNSHFNKTPDALNCGLRYGEKQTPTDKRGCYFHL